VLSCLATNSKCKVKPDIYVALILFAEDDRHCSRLSHLDRIFTMPDPFVGEITQVAFDFAPKDWAKCDGSFVPIGQNQILYAAIGTKFGGNGVTNFALPDARGRTLIGTGILTYPNKSNGGTYNIGDKNGSEQTTLTTSQMPAHNHLLVARQNVPNDDLASDPNNMHLSNTNDPNASGIPLIYAPANSGAAVPMNPNSISANGAGLPFSLLQPYIAVTTLIALTGEFPIRQ